MAITVEIIATGSLPNDGTGDPLRDGFIKINNNFSTLSNTAFGTTTVVTTGTSPQVIFQTPVATFTQGEFHITSSSAGVDDGHQRVTLSSFLSNDLTEVKFVGTATAFFGSPVTTYDMAITGPNVQIIVTPLVSETITHSVSSQIIYFP